MKNYFICFLLLVCLSADAQFSGRNVQLGFVHYSGNTPMNGFGLGGGSDVWGNGKLMTGFSSNFYFGSKSVYVDTLSYGSTRNIYRNVMSFTGGYGIRYYAVGDFESETSFYGLGEVGVALFFVRTKKADDYDKTLLRRKDTNVPDQPGRLEIVEGFTLNIGVGFEKALEVPWVFGNIRYHWPIGGLMGGNQTGLLLTNAITAEIGLRYKIE